MILFNFFKKKSVKMIEVKEKFQKFLYENEDERAYRFLQELCKKNKKKCPQYAKLFFNVFKDKIPKKAVEVVKPYIFDENDISFLKVYITRLKKIGEIELANQLLKKIGESKFIISKTDVENILNSNDKEQAIKNLLKDLPEQKEKILFYVFSILKDKETEIAVKYGLEYLKIRPDDFRFFNILKKRIKNISLNEDNKDFYNQLDEQIKYYHKVKKSLLKNNSVYKLKKDLQIAIKKISNEKLVLTLIIELLENNINIEKTLLYKTVYNVLKNNYYETLALHVGEEYLRLNISDRKFKNNLEKLKLQIDEKFKKNLISKNLKIIEIFDLDKKFDSKKFKLLLERIKDYKDFEFDFIINEIEKKYKNKNDEINKIIFSELKDYNTFRAIRFGKKYVEKHLDDCKFLKVFLKRLEKVQYLDELFLYAKKSVNFCKDKEIEFIVFKFNLREDMEELNKLNKEKQVDFILRLEEKYKDYRFFLYRELFNFYKRKNYELAEMYAKKSLELNYNEYVIKDLYDLYIYYGDLTKAFKILPNNPQLHTLEVKKANILSLLDLYNNGFDIKIQKVPSYFPEKDKIFYLLHNRLPYNSGGYATRSHGLLAGIKNYGWDIHGISRLGYPIDKILNVQIKEVDIIDGVSYHVLLNGDIGLGKLPLKKYLEEYANALLKLAIKEKPFVIHAASNYMNGVVANYVAKCLRTKSIYEVRGLWELTRISRQPEWKDTEYYNLMVKMEAEAAQNADLVFTLTNALKEEMINRGVDANKIYVLPNGVEVERFKPLEKNWKLAKQLKIENKTVIGFIGSFVQYEGLEYIVDAMEVLVRKKGKNDVIALMVGDGAVWQSIVDRVRKKRLDEYFIFTGRVPHEEVEKYYSLIDIIVLPRKGLPVCEMVSPLKPFEAMAMEKVVLASNVAALKEIIKDGYNGMLFEKDNVLDLVNKIELLCNNKIIRDKIGKQAREWVIENRSWEKIVSFLNEVYLEFKEKHKSN